MSRTYQASGGVYQSVGGVYRSQPAATNDPPSASFTYSPSNPETVDTVSFDGSGSSDPDGSITSYSWDFTNDGAEDATGSTASHSYSSSGDYTAVLTVTDDDGATDTATQTISVSPEMIESFERSSPLAAYNGATADFTVVSSPVYDGSKALEANTASRRIVGDSSTGTLPTVQAGDTLRWFQRTTIGDSASSNHLLGFIFGGQNIDDYAMVRMRYEGPKVDAFKYRGSFTQLGESTNFSSSPPTAAYHGNELDWGTGGTLTHRVFDGDFSSTELVSHQFSDSALASDGALGSGQIGWYSEPASGESIYGDYVYRQS